jgi:hypothetical protein
LPTTVAAAFMKGEGYVSATKQPKTVEDLADESMEGFETLLRPSTFKAIHTLVSDLYATHPVMRRLADEALVDSRAPRVESDEQLKPGAEEPEATSARKSDAS